MSWKDVTFGDVVNLQQGLAFNKKNNFLMVENGIPLLRITDLINGTESKFVDEEKVSPKFISKLGDIIYSRTGQVGLVFRGRIGVVHNNCFRVIPNPSLDPGYVYHYLRQPSVISHARSLASGAAQPDLNHDAFKSIAFKYPQLPVQRRIASILSAYDDLIENNTRCIAILEEMARRLYDEWFVHFRFPGHEEVEFEGKLPSGWRERCLADLVTTQYGYTASTSENPVGPQFLRGMDINKRSFIDWSKVPFCPIKPEKVGKYRLVPGDLLVIRMADPGKIGFIEEEVDAVFASYLVRLKLKPNELTPLYLFFVLNSSAYQDYITGASTGTTRKSASSGVITGYDVVVPPVALVKKFQSIASPLRDQIKTLVKKNANLRAQYDLLLPNLVSGEIDVNKAENTMEAAE